MDVCLIGDPVAIVRKLYKFFCKDLIINDVVFVLPIILRTWTRRIDMVLHSSRISGTKSR